MKGSSARLGLLLLAAVALLTLTGCEKATPDLDQSGIEAISNIPIEYGSLRGVTSTEQYPGWAQLWFQDDAGTVRMVRIKWVSKQMPPDVITIPRTGSMGGGN